jgi:FAD/FMN-containing dehydrogenase
MLPLLVPEDQLSAPYAAFVSALRNSDFRGEICTDYGTRLTHATDNSVYQLLPALVLYPKSTLDIQLTLRLLSQPEHQHVRLSPRGGGTGTNGQSLCDGIMMDVSRHLKSILELNLSEGWVRVEPGVVLDQLNAYLAPHQVFFAPNLSPSSRATLGGMVSTDASGKGSRVYGKTSEHVLETESVLLGGEILRTKRLSPDELAQKKTLPGSEGHIYREISAIMESSRARILTELPKLRRFLTGYDLAHVQEDDGTFDLGRVISGSEGTLSVLTSLKLRLTPLSKHKRLVAVRYGNFDAALRAAQTLAALRPGAIETIDSLIVSLAKEDVIWHSVAHLIDAEGEPELAALNLVEFEGPDEAEVVQKAEELCKILDEERFLPGKSIGYTVASQKADILALWSLRKKGVGLLGNAKGERRPVPFVEDTVVPPEHLADYIKEFRAVLDAHGLRYGMFGHVDVGCLHVRPALDLKTPEDEQRLGEISDAIVRLVKKYGGVLWGEHGRGYRSQYTPTFFGPELSRDATRQRRV